MPRLVVPTGKFYHDFAILLYYLNDVMNKEDFVEFTAYYILKPKEKELHLILDDWFLDSTIPSTLVYKITRLRNGKYGISGYIEKISKTRRKRYR